MPPPSRGTQESTTFQARPTVPCSWAAGSVYDSADDVAVLDGDRLAGLVPIERLLAAPEDRPLGAIMDADPPVVGVTVIDGAGPCMFGATADPGHRAMRVVFTMTGHIPRRVSRRPKGGP